MQLNRHQVNRYGTLEQGLVGEINERNPIFLHDFLHVKKAGLKFSDLEIPRRNNMYTTHVHCCYNNISF